MDIVGFALLIIGALCTFLSGVICRMLRWDDSQTSSRGIAIKIVGFVISFVGALIIFGLF